MTTHGCRALDVNEVCTDHGLRALHRLNGLQPSKAIKSQHTRVVQECWDLMALREYGPISRWRARRCICFLQQPASRGDNHLVKVFGRARVEDGV